MRIVHFFDLPGYGTFALNIRKVNIPCQLLRYGRWSAYLVGLPKHLIKHSPYHPFIVEAVMLIEGFVFDRYKSIFRYLRDFRGVKELPVLRIIQPVYLLAVGIIQIRCLLHVGVYFLWIYLLAGRYCIRVICCASNTRHDHKR